MIVWELAPSLSAAVLILLVPGLLVARSMGARGWCLAGTVMPTSVSIIAVTAILCGFFHIQWNLLPVFAMSVSLALIATGTRIYLRKRSGSRVDEYPRNSAFFATPKLVSMGAIAVPFIIIMVRFAQIIERPDNISQTFDNIFHLNAIRYIGETGNASSLLVAGFTSSDGVAGFYPAAWHDLVSLVVQVSGNGIPQAVNATNMVIAAVLWPLSSLFLIVALFGAERAGLLVGAVLSTGFASFPYLMVDFGVLYPNFLSIGILPAAIALVVALLRLGMEYELSFSQPLILLMALLPGLALAHPSTLMALMLWTLPAFVAITLRRVGMATGERGPRAGRWWPLLALLCYIALAAVLWKVLRPEEAMSTWEPIQTLSQAIGQALTSAPIRGPIPWTIFFLTLLGLYALARDPRGRWFLGVFVVSCLVFVFVSGYRFSDLRTYIGGVWYNDPYRPAALLPVAALPVATFGAKWLWHLISDRLRSMPLANVPGGAGRKHSAALTIGAWLCLIAVLVGLIQRGAVRDAVAHAAQNYQYNSESPLLSTDERELLSRVPAYVAPDDALIASPWTGASLVYAFSDRRSLSAHIFGKYDESTLTVLQNLDALSSNPEVCRAVKKLNSYYLLDFGTKGVHGTIEPSPGTTQLDLNPNFRLIDSQGSSKLYRITACDT